MHGAQLTFSPRQGPAMELLRLAQVCGWATAGWRPLVLFFPTGEGQCVGCAVWPIDNSSIKTNKSVNLICIGLDGGNKEARVKAFLGLHEAGTQNACAAVLIQQPS